MLRRKPRIGITTSSYDGCFMKLCTKLGVWICGGKVVKITPDNYDKYSRCDGFIIAGGTDVDPALYGGKKDENTRLDLDRDKLDMMILNHAIDAQKPVLGISRGAHIINIVFGGTLHQETHHFYEDMVPSTTLLGQTFGRRRVKFIEDGIIKQMLKRRGGTFRVNTIHHQVNDRVGKGLKCIVLDEKGVCQAIEFEDSDKQFILGVEWHPEFMLHSRTHRKLFIALVGMAKVYARTKREKKKSEN